MSDKPQVTISIPDNYGVETQIIGEITVVTTRSESDGRAWTQ